MQRRIDVIGPERSGTLISDIVASNQPTGKRVLKRSEEEKLTTGYILKDMMYSIGYKNIQSVSSVLPGILIITL